MNRATISADIVSSTELTPCVLSQLQNEIDTFFNLIGNKYPGTWGRLSKGDSVEIYIDDPQNSLRIALLLKTLIKKFKVDKESVGENVNKKRLDMFKTYGVRVAIAVGEMRIAERKREHANMCLFHVMAWNYVQPFTEGKTYMKISQFVLLVDLLGLYNDKRLKLDRNTILNLKVVC